MLESKFFIWSQSTFFELYNIFLYIFIKQRNSS